VATLADIPQRSLLDAWAPEETAPAARPSTLEDLVTVAWASLTTAHVAACPLCDGDVVARFGAGHRPVAGTCRSCGTELS
jgi:capsular polysaccharide biosynthesis protein